MRDRARRVATEIGIEIEIVVMDAAGMTTGVGTVTGIGTATGAVVAGRRATIGATKAARGASADWTEGTAAARGAPADWAGTETEGTAAAAQRDGAKTIATATAVKLKAAARASAWTKTAAPPCTTTTRSRI